MVTTKQNKKMFKFTGFDVGMINLAYCVIEPNKQQLICQHQLKNKKLCCKPATFEDKGKKEYYCNVHSKIRKGTTKIDVYAIPWEIKEWKLINLIDQTGGKCCGIIKKNQKVCDKVCYNRCQDDQTKFYCGIHKRGKATDLIKKKNTKNTSNMELVLSLIKHLDQEMDILGDSHRICIENQPRFNGRMKLFAANIFGHLITRCMVDKQKKGEQVNVKMIKYSAAKNELKHCNQFKDFVYPAFVYNKNIKTTKQKQKYSYKKAKDTAFCKFLIEKYKQDDFLNFFNNCPKKDDLSDAFLLAFDDMIQNNK